MKKLKIAGIVFITVTVLLLGARFAANWVQDYASPYSEVDVQDLRDQFPSFIQAQLKKEKENARFVKVEIESVTKLPNGLINIVYNLHFDDLVSGQWTPSGIEASATLLSENQVWKVVKVETRKEITDFPDEVL